MLNAKLPLLPHDWYKLTNNKESAGRILFATEAKDFGYGIRR